MKEKNQCDGCKLGFIEEYGIHYNKGKVIMGCTKDRYAMKETNNCEGCDKGLERKGTEHFEPLVPADLGFKVTPCVSPTIQEGKKEKWCYACGSAPCDYGTTGCPWYKESLILALPPGESITTTSPEQAQEIVTIPDSKATESEVSSSDWKEKEREAFIAFESPRFTAGGTEVSLNRIADYWLLRIEASRNDVAKEIISSIQYKLEKSTGKTKYHDGWRDGLQAGIDYSKKAMKNE